MKKEDIEQYPRYLYVISILMLLILSCIAIAPAAMGQTNIIGQKDIRVTFISQDPDPVEPGKYVDVRFKIENYGSYSMEDVIFEIIPEYPFYLEEGEDLIQELGTVQKRQMEEDAVIIKWRLRVDEDAVEGRNEIELRYKTKGQGWIKFEPFDIDVKTKYSLLAVSAIESTPERIAPGSTGKMNIYLKNVGDSLISNIKVTLDLTGTDIATVGSSNEKIIDNLEGSEELPVEYNLAVNTGAEIKVHNIPFKVTYTDESNKEYELQNSFGIIVDSKPSYVMNLEETAIYKTKQNGDIIISISNTGSANINYLTIELEKSEHYDVISSPIVYMGNLESDDFETAEFKIYTHSDQADVPLKLNMNYKDDYNTDYDEEKELSLRLFSQSDAVKFGLEKKQSITSSIFSLMLMIPLIIFWVAMLGDCISRKMPRSKKAIWLIIIIGSLIVGAALYYFMGRKHRG